MSSLFVCQLLPSNRSLGVESSPYCHLQHNNKYSARNNFLRISNSLNQERDALVDNEGNNIQQINPKHIPKHIGVIMDGNRRWAKARVLPVQEGHKFLTPNLINICKVSSKLGIQVVTAFAASTENLKRDKEEIDFLKQHFEELFDEILRVGVRVSVIGDRSKYPVNLLKRIELAEETTKDNTELHLLVALNYGGQHDIMQATKSIASKVKDGLLQLEDIDNKVFEQELFTKCAKFPIPDLIIRTGGEQRISNFLLWQLAYSELYFTKTLFPDFGEEDLKEAILSFQRRHRRFGGHTY